ncbi:MAG: hypothetical protein ACYDHG_03020 [Desulfomonilaceae bacterium]
MKKEWKFNFRILINEQEDLWVAHCLELDLVAASPTKEEFEKDIIDICLEQVRYSIVNDDMENLFVAPQEVWDEFNACKRKAKPRLQVYAPQQKHTPSISLVTNRFWK